MNLFLKIYHKLISPPLECAKLYRLNLTKFTIKERYVSFEHFEFIQPTIKNLEQFAILYSHNESKIDTVSNRFQTGNYICFAYIDTQKKRLAYARWICKQEFYSDTLREELRFNKDEVLTMDSWTHPDYRGLGLHRKMNIEMLNWLKINTEIKYVFMVIRCFIPHLKKIPLELGYTPIRTRVRLNIVILAVC